MTRCKMTTIKYLGPIIRSGCQMAILKSLSKALQDKIHPELAEPAKPIRKLTLMAPYIGLAAAFLIIALAYRQLPDRMLPKPINSTQVEADITSDLPMWYFPDNFELIEYLSGTEGAGIEVYSDSIMFDGIVEDDLVNLTLFD
jgi:hypothetical protein